MNQLEPQTFFLHSNRKLRMFALMATGFVALTIVFWWLNPGQKFRMLSSYPADYILFLPLKLILSVVFLSLFLGLVFSFFIWRVKSTKRQLILRSTVFMTLPMAVLFCLPAAYGVIKNIVSPAKRFEVIVKLEPGEAEREVIDGDDDQFLTRFRARLVMWGAWIEEIERMEDHRLRITVAGDLDQDLLVRLTKKGGVGFYETTDFNEGFRALEIVNSRITQLMKVGQLPVTKAMRRWSQILNPDSTFDDGQPDSSVYSILHPNHNDEVNPESLGLEDRKIRFAAENPVIGMMTIMPVDRINGNHPLMGYVKKEDREQMALYLNHPEVKKLYSKDIEFMFSAQPSDLFDSEDGDYYDLIAVLKEPDGGPAVSGEYLADVRVITYKYQVEPSFIGKDVHSPNRTAISLRFNNEGSRKWEVLTENNLDHCIAIVINGEVISYPNVLGRITGGKADISGNFTKEEAGELAHMMRFGAYHANAVLESMKLLGE